MRKFLIATLLGFVLLGACSSPGEDHLIGDQDAAAPSASPSTETDQAAPLRPTMQRSAAGAEAQVRYALEVIDFAKTTGQIEELLELSREGCVPCADALDAVRADRAGDIPKEETVPNAATSEGDSTQVPTLVIVDGDQASRVWRLSWENSSWEFGSISQPVSDS